jgi:glutaredoxin
MTTTCPKCRYTRKPSDDAPNWQCPSCGIAYAKVTDAYGNYRSPEEPVRHSTYVETTRGNGLPWIKLIFLLLFILVAWKAGHGIWSKQPSSETPVKPRRGTVEEIKALAATVNPGDIVVYTRDGCPAVVETKNWLNQYNFAFTECNISASQRCMSEFQSHRATGTPHLIVHGEHMTGLGERFLEILRERSSAGLSSR